jgi:hypothetical protein
MGVPELQHAFKSNCSPPSEGDSPEETVPLGGDSPDGIPEFDFAVLTVVGTAVETAVVQTSSSES